MISAATSLIGKKPTLWISKPVMGGQHVHLTHHVPRSCPQQLRIVNQYHRNTTKAGAQSFNMCPLVAKIVRGDVPRVNVSDTHRLESLDDKNAKLKRLVAETVLDNVVLKDLLGQN